jgi:phosphohistidine swiveling domain-containing protein
MLKTAVKERYELMYETRNVRPYYTIVHLGALGTPFRRLTGFSYKKTIYVTSAEMNNSAYFSMAEMKRATRHFDRIWRNGKKTQQLLRYTREGFRKAAQTERWAWRQNWSDCSDRELLKASQDLYQTLWRVFTTMLLSQPQHVASLEARINKSLQGFPNRDELLRAATYFPGDSPWAEEEREIERLHRRWKTMRSEAKGRALASLVRKYGWFNTIEGRVPFDAHHYRDKIVNFVPEKKGNFSKVKIPLETRAVGKLIGELGFLRFWNRYHFMHVRYHLHAVLHELIKRQGLPVLEYATVQEIMSHARGRYIDLAKIGRRAEGYASCLVKGHTDIRTGRAAKKLRDLVKQKVARVQKITGSIANRGKASGRVRVISFGALDYENEVAAFRKGEILVTGMTRPQIVHLCKKAAAIVTDEGGITSHAAVVSREFNLPCVIATRYGTKVLKTGDMVEVDAERGIITVITKK